MEAATLESWVGKVLYYLSFRVRSRREITTYLQGKGASAEDILAIMARVDDLKLIDDGEFIRQLINARLNKGYGSKKIRFDLLNKGINRDLAASSLAAVPLSAWIDSAGKYLGKKYADYTTDPHTHRHDIYRVLSAKGHDSGTITAVIDELAHPE